jgi:hypothetical protein
MSSDPRALTRSPSARRGSTLLLTLVLLLALALVMASTLPSVLTQYRLEHQQTLGVTAFNLAEGGAEVALWTLAQSTEAAALAEAGWELDEDGDFYFRELSLADLGGDALAPVTAQVRVVFTQPADTSLVRIYALARVTTPGSRETVTRRVVVEAEIGAPGVRSSPFHGLFTDGSFTINNYNFFDSFDSTVFPHTYAPGVNDGANITVGTNSTRSRALYLGTSEVRGTVRVAADEEVAADSVWGHGGYSVSGGVEGNFSLEMVPVTVPDTRDWPTSF